MEPKIKLPWLALLVLSACSTTHAAREDGPETSRPAPPVRIARDRTPETPDLRGKPFAPTGSTCALAYRATDESTGREVLCEVLRGTSCLELMAAGQTWIFERNPVHHEEVTGFRVDGERRKLIEYPFTDLAFEGVARSWSSLVRLGVAPAELAELERTGESVEAFGIRFDELRDPDASSGMIGQIFWSEEHQLPLRVLRAGGGRIEVESLRLTSSTGRQSARDAYPGYAVQDVADWREALHDHAPTAPAAKGG